MHKIGTLHNMYLGVKCSGANDVCGVTELIFTLSKLENTVCLKMAGIEPFGMLVQCSAN